ncbi:MAG: hypothetical protein HQM08_28260 [Candidatus Riflebacteria bacterium]|nr:hypothetical protein [Candidatus Riflebacteria bacterium]
MAQIGRLRNLDKYRQAILLLLFFIVLVLINLWKFHFSENLITRVIFSFNCIPISLIFLHFINRIIDWYIERQFIKKWDPLFLERTKQTEGELLASEEILKLTDDIYFVSLSTEEQKIIVNQVYKKHGLCEPNL